MNIHQPHPHLLADLPTELTVLYFIERTHSHRTHAPKGKLRLERLRKFPNQLGLISLSHLLFSQLHCHLFRNSTPHLSQDGKCI